MKRITYEEFLSSAKHDSGATLREETETIVEHFRPKQFMSRFAGTTFLLDYSTKKYLYVEDTCLNVLGYRHQWFLENGLKEYLSYWHPDDYDVLNKKVIPDCLNFVKDISPENYSQYIISYNYRFKNPKGKYITVLQRWSYIPGSIEGVPAGMIGAAFDISHYKTDLSIVHTIEKEISTPYGPVDELVFKKVHPVYEDQKKRALSKKEIEILKLLAEGLSSKQIADKMSLSINTVNNHRKNMLVKIDCKTSSELTSFAIRHGVL